MRAARYHGRRDVRVDEVSEQTVGPTDVRVKIEACGICGSDLHEYQHGPVSIPDSHPHPVSGETIPVRLGHEFAGRIVEIGASVDRFREGDPVTVNPIISCGQCRYCIDGEFTYCTDVMTLGLQGNGGGFADSTVVPESNAVELPDELSFEQGALVEPLSVAVHAVRRSSLEAGDDVAVFGAGSIGLGVVQAAQAAGAKRVYVSEPVPSRRSLAAKFGAGKTYDPGATDPVSEITAATDGGVDVALEAAGIEETLTAAIRSTRKGGNTTVISVFTDNVTLNPNLLMMAERTLTGTFGYQSGPLPATGEFGTTIQLLQDGRLSAESLITDRISLERIVSDGFEPLVEKPSEHVKILVKP